MQNITSATITTLIPQSTGEFARTASAVVRVTNNHGGEQNISVFLDDGTNQFYLIKNIVIPVAFAFTLDPLSFETDEYALKIETHTSTTNITVRGI